VQKALQELELERISKEDDDDDEEDSSTLTYGCASDEEEVYLTDLEADREADASMDDQ